MTEKNKATNSKKTEAVKVTGRTPHHSYDLKVRIEDISFGAVFKIWFFKNDSSHGRYYLWSYYSINNCLSWVW